MKRWTVLVCLLLAGCDFTTDSIGRERKGQVPEKPLICIDGVTYITYTTYGASWGMTAKFDKDSKIVPCTE